MLQSGVLPGTSPVVVPPATAVDWRRNEFVAVVAQTTVTGHLDRASPESKQFGSQLEEAR